MARFKIELEDTEDGMNFKIDANGLATTETLRANTTTQNAAIAIIDLLRRNGIGGDKLPDLIVRKTANDKAVRQLAAHKTSNDN